MNYQLRDPFRIRPNWSKDAKDYNKVMDSFFNSTLLKNVLSQESFEEIGSDTPLDIIFNSLLYFDEDKEYMEKGENSFSISNDNQFYLLTTLSFELLESVYEEDYDTMIWKLFKSGYFKFKVSGTFKQESSSLFWVKLDASLPEAQVYDYFNKRTYEESSLDKNIRSLSERNSHGFMVDLSPVFTLLPCFGIKEDSIQASIQQRQVRVSFDFSREEPRDCRISKDMASNSLHWASDMDLKKFRFLSEERATSPKLKRRQERELAKHK